MKGTLQAKGLWKPDEETPVPGVSTITFQKGLQVDSQKLLTQLFLDEALGLSIIHGLDHSPLTPTRKEALEFWLSALPPQLVVQMLCRPGPSSARYGPSLALVSPLMSQHRGPGRPSTCSGGRPGRQPDAQLPWGRDSELRTLGT